MDDRDLLLEYIRDPSSGAFTTLVERHIDIVYAAALRRVGGDHHRAMEVTQQVFTDLARKAGKVADHPVLVGWLHRSTRWAAATLQRNERRHAFRQQTAARELELATMPETQSTVDWTLLRNSLDQALDQLRSDDRDAILLRFFSNASHAEIGARLGLSENAARMRVERALERLQTILRRHGITSTAVALGTALARQPVSAAPAGVSTAVAAKAVAAAAATATTGTTAAVGVLLGKLHVALVLTLAGVLGVTWQRTARAADQQRTQLVAAQQEAALRRAELHEIQVRVNAQEAERAQSAAIQAAIPALTPAQQERQRLDLLIRRGELDLDYATLFRRLKLAPEVLDRLKTLLVQRNQAEYDALQAAHEQTVELSIAEQRELTTVATRDVDDAVAALLGPDKMAVFSRYVATVHLREGLLPVSLATDDTRQDTADALLDLLERTAPTFGDDCLAAGSNLPLPRAFLEGAKPLLTPQELRELELRNQMLEVRNKMDEMARAAAYAGKLKLSKGSAKLYAQPAPAAAGR